MYKIKITNNGTKSLLEISNKDEFDLMIKSIKRCIESPSDACIINYHHDNRNAIIFSPEYIRNSLIETTIPK